MNLKSLLLGSTAIFVAASTAQAADAILVEPEPVEYVRVCDAYGSGFFFLPGTETCMKLSGYVRSTYKHNTTTNGGIKDPDHASWTYRGRLNIDVRNETDWGTLRSELRLQGGSAPGGGDANVGLDRALISFAGFRVGYSFTYWETAHGSAVGSLAIEDGMYNSDQAIFFDYTYAVDGFALTVGVQDSTGTVNDSENPDLYVGGKYTGDWGWVAATYIYDQNGVDFSTGLATGAGAWKASTRLENIGDSGWNFGAWYMSDGDDASSYVTGGYGATAALVDYQWGVVLDGALSDDITGYVLYSAAEAIGSSTTYIDTTHLAVGVVWAPIEGLGLQIEYYANESDFVLAASDTDTDGVIVRAIRSW
ncbi:MAG: porin [Rhizobiaceae bacterium]